MTNDEIRTASSKNGTRMSKRTTARQTMVAPSRFTPTDDYLMGGARHEFRLLAWLGLLGYPLDGTDDDVAAWYARRAEVAALDARPERSDEHD